MATKHRTERRLKIDPIHRGFRKADAAGIRLRGLWLRSAGFTPGAHVKVTLTQPGVLEVRLDSPAPLMGEDFTNALTRLDAALAA